ncbi:unnamed protein product [Rotaria sp. Silwood1]|nr:unnamed protein product [Rotaria sp. Silwood1]CAF0857598.1 unnamed protein product [Rotaria sp. Silwood1]CAF3354652.1 unnamed protein product [Rotaria sp. Silwood1]CAF4483532.1 unnamed protein product [Rotaria sp. Silwood1]CAF4514800.1 unnamed protein product [Rotaria sp. Silwood1]
MVLVFLFLLLIGTNLIVSNNSSSFDLILNLDGIDNYFRFVETTKSNKQKYYLPTVIILDDDHTPTIRNSSHSSSIETYHVESDENLYGFASIINRTSLNNGLLFATVQISNGSLYDISSLMSIRQTKAKRSFNDAYIIRSKQSIIKQAYVTIEWNNNRERRDIDEADMVISSSVKEEERFPASEQMSSTTLPSVSLPHTMENITVPSAENDTQLLINDTVNTTAATTPRPIPKKSRHLYLEITALIDSLIINDLRSMLNKTELETIEILKLYYINIFTSVEQLYQQSLIHETLDVHIHLSKIIFATNKHRLPWESLKNLSSLTDPYRKSPNNVHLRPNISTSLLKSLHQVYTSNKFDERFFRNGADHIITFTRLDLIEGAGSAYVLGTCLPLFRYSIIQEDLNSYIVAITVAHELGHNLGLDHDEIENNCNHPRFRYIMSPKNMNTVDRRQVPYFSECSINQLNNFVDNTTTTCWKNKIINIQNDTKLAKIRNITSLKLGQIVNIRQQCQLQYGPQAIPFISIIYNSKNQTLYEENICNQLQCFKTPEDEYMYWQDGAFDGTSCGENRVCHKKQCVLTNQTMKQTDLDICPYGDLFVPIHMLYLADKSRTGNMLCPDALNLLRSRGMNVTYLCYESTLPFRRLCCEECKKHLISECGDQNSQCSMFSQYCSMAFLRINGEPVKKLCPYTCGHCPHLPPPSTTTTTVTTMIMTTEEMSSTKTKKITPGKKIQTTTLKPRKYIKPENFDKYTCIDSADCSQLIKAYSKLKKKVKNWCTEYSTMIEGRYFVEMCPKYCSLCNITSECDQYKLCRNNGTCIKDQYGTYQCLCSTSKSYYGTLCEYRHTCLKNSCSSKNEFCIQTQGESYICLSKEDKEQMRVILN